MNKGNGGPSLKKKFVGLIRNLSQPGCTSDQDQNIDNSRTYRRPDTFIHKYLNGEGRPAQPPIIFGRSVEELPPRALGRLRRRTFAAFTGPGGGLAAVNRTNPSLEISEPDVDFIDSEDSLPDDQPNAYVTCQRPPPRKNLFSDIAEYFRMPRQPAILQGLNQNGIGSGDGLEPRPFTEDDLDNLALNGDAGDSDDSLDCSSNTDLRRSENEEIAGIVNWNRPHERAFGLSTTLYERHPVTHERAGNPIADAFGVIARENNAVLALADGVNWGEQASLAAKCAIHGCLSHINKALFSPGVSQPTTTTDIFVALLRSFHTAHSLILQEEGMLTTLTVAIVAPLANSEKFVVCVCNVGDSLAYVYSETCGVREITQGSHDIYSMRDMRDALGALGPVDGQNPELNNLTCSMTFCDRDDVVFLTSDGISDNFDPVVGKFVLPKAEPKERLSNSSKFAPQIKPHSNEHGTKESLFKNGRSHGRGGSGYHLTSNHHNRAHKTVPRPRHSASQGSRTQRQSSQTKHDGFKQPVSRSKSQPAVSETEVFRHDPFLPFVEAHQRHELTLLRMVDLLRCGLTTFEPVTTAQALCYEMVHFATKLTVAKRRILEDPDLYPPEGAPQDLSRNDQRNRRRKVCEKLALVPGKLDHATVVAYKVGNFPHDDSLSDSDDELPMLNQPVPAMAPDFRAPLASPDSLKSIFSLADDRNSRHCGVSSWKYPVGQPKLASKAEFETTDKHTEIRKENKDIYNKNGNSEKLKHEEEQNFKKIENGNKSPHLKFIESVV